MLRTLDPAVSLLLTIANRKMGANTLPANVPSQAGRDPGSLVARQAGETTNEWQIPTHGSESKSVSGVLTAPKNAMPVLKLTAAGIMLNFPAWGEKVGGWGKTMGGKW